MIKRVWTGDSKIIESLSWSPRGSHLASGRNDGTTQTICIWDSNTGELIVGPIEDLGNAVRPSVVWSSGGSELYSASDKFARVFDSVSGTQLHYFQHNRFLYSVALSPKHNVLACVGNQGVAQLWDTESYEPLGPPFRQDGNTYFVSAAGYGGQSLQVAGMYWTRASIRIGAYKAPGTSLWTRYAFLVDTTMKMFRARTHVGFAWMHSSLSRELVRPFCFTSTRNKTHYISLQDYCP
jgi:WD40 repeat protein